ncbi:hypothetical protein VTN77DRAFT_2675 [Rasamsonia byssochlamydoides]|uniref:uncharacterized protein n=1 Tax=Rasamsonia byssochlamydoides TaxID=89139 RepID=UPI00374256D0
MSPHHSPQRAPHPLRIRGLSSLITSLGQELLKKIRGNKGFDQPSQTWHGQEAHIVLVPQPSDDPNDPLNWPECRKLTVIMIICYGSILIASVLAPLLSAGSAAIAVNLGDSIGSIVLISGYMLLVTGTSGPVISSCAQKWGKRPCFIFSSLFALIGSIMGATSNSYRRLLAARIVQGFSVSAYESLAVSVIGDLYFLHQRGAYMSLINFILGALSNFSSVIMGPITNNLGWRAYNRDHKLDIDEISRQNSNQDQATGDDKIDKKEVVAEKQDEDTPRKQHVDHQSNSTRVIPAAQRPPKTFWQRMAIFTGTYTDENLIQLIIAPLAVCLNLSILWVVVASGTLTALYVAVSYVLAQIFSYPPYNLSTSFTQEGKSYYATATMHGVALFGIMFGTTTTGGYVLDAFREMSNEVFIMAMVFKNFLFYVFSYFVNEWTARAGPAQVFYVFGGVAFAVTFNALGSAGSTAAFIIGAVDVALKYQLWANAITFLAGCPGLLYLGWFSIADEQGWCRRTNSNKQTKNVVSGKRMKTSAQQEVTDEESSAS